MYLDNPNKVILNEINELSRNIYKFDFATMSLIFDLLFKSYLDKLTNEEVMVLLKFHEHLGNRSNQYNSTSTSQRAYNRPPKYTKNGKEKARSGVGKHISQVNVIKKRR